MSDKHLLKSCISEESCIRLANQLITQCSLATPLVSHVSEINSNLIVSLCEVITGLSVPDLLVCESKSSEAHNVQAVIDTLSLDFLGISLSHITGDAVMSGDVVAIFNLLEVLEGVMLHLSNKNHGERVMKRKVNRIKNCSPRSSKQNFETKEGNTSSDGSVGSQFHTSTSLSTESKKLKPAFSKTKLKAKENMGNKYFKEICLSKEAPIKTISASQITSSSQTPILTLSSQNIESNGSPSLHNDFNDANSKESNSCVMPAFSSQGENSDRVLTATENLPSTDVQDVSTDMQIKPFVMKRKIAKISDSKNKNFAIEQEVEKLYGENLEAKLKEIIEKHSCLRRRTSQVRKSYLQNMKNPLKKSPLPACNKSYLLPHSLRRSTTLKNSIISRKNNPSQKLNSLRKPLSIKKDKDNDPKQYRSFITDILEEFPGIELSPTIMNHVKANYEQHLLKMQKKVKACLLKKPKAEMEAENALEKQRAISKILKKDAHQQQYLHELQEQRNHQNKIKYRLRDARLKSVRMKQYCDEFQQEMRKKMQKRNFSEEIIFEKAFKEAISIQKDHVDHLCQQVIEAGDADAKQYLKYLISLENLYQTQFASLSEALTNERKDVQIRIKAEKQEIDKMQRDFQQTLKSEIRLMQKTIVELTEDCHFRELDAEQYIERIRDENM